MQRQPDLLDRKVEGEGGALVDAILAADLEEATLGPDQVAGAPVLDHHALRPAGGTRGVNDVAKIARPDFDRAARQARGAQSGDGVVVGVEPDDHAAVGGRTIPQVRGRHERTGGRIFEDAGDALRRAFGVDRQIGRARLEDSEERRVGVDGPGEKHRHDRAAPHAPASQMAREAVRAALQIGVGRFLPAEDDGDRLRPGIGPGLEQSVKDFLARHGAGQRAVVASIRAGVLAREWA